MTVENVKPPFSAAQIRDASRKGRTYTFQLSSEKGVIHHRIRFLAVSPESMTLEMQDFDPDGTPLNDTRRHTGTWAELEGHATYPKAATVLTDAEITVPAGTYDCWVYTVTEAKNGGTEVTTAAFAKAIPGAPVWHTVVRDGQAVTTMELVKLDLGAE